ncbi:hypothetical protein C8K18_105254 [Paraburkholderia sp. GV068]|uniref:Uncharacterized protein n=1 Tax=Paraburkholderia graminis TaxID=60548 RepID=A0ABD5CMU3_9BURK|nr:hypothetical protein [Paraburkholderia graminis]MDR6206648.1 hypothetical protein [Paraburkholderia graminis]PUB05331.1 hypothetical protein C8K18_105254 [Paraburkholderia sp. GV068]
MSDGALSGIAPRAARGVLYRVAKALPPVTQRRYTE